MTFEIKMTPKTREVVLKIPRHVRLHKRGMRKALNQIGRHVVLEDQRLIKSPPKTGRIYKFNGRDHQASAPGESPANRTGRLAGSARFATRNHQEMTVGEVAPYAGFLEDGTKKMAPRPHLIKAVNANHRNAVKELEQAAIKEIK